MATSHTLTSFDATGTVPPGDPASVRIDEAAPVPQATGTLVQENWGTGGGSPFEAFVGWNTSYAPFAGELNFQPAGNQALNGRYGGYWADRVTLPNQSTPGVYSEAQLRVAIAWSRWLYQYNPFAMAFINTAASYIGPMQVQFVKKGTSATAGATASGEGDADPLIADCQAIWDEWCVQNGWGPGKDSEPDAERESRIRFMRDGEAVLRLGHGSPEANFLPWLRFVEPEQIRSPEDESRVETKGDWRWGVCTPRNDARRVLAYWVCSLYSGGGAGEEVSPNEIVRAKANVDGVIKRGVTDLFNVETHLQESIGILGNLEGTTREIAGVAWVQKYATATEEQVRGMLIDQGRFPVDAAGRLLRDGSGSGEGGFEFPWSVNNGARIIHARDNMEFDAGPSLANATAIKEVIQLTLAAVGLVWGFPDSFVLGDPQGFAAALVEGSQLVRNIGDRQDQQRGLTSELARTVIRMAEESGRLPHGTARQVEPLVTAKPVIIADEEKQVRTLIAEIDAGILDKQEAIKKRQRDPKVVMANIKAWDAEMGPPPGQEGGPGPNGLPPTGPTPAPPGSAGGDGESPNTPEEVGTESVLEGAGPHAFGSTQINLAGEAAYAILTLGRLVRDEDLAADGREDEPHVTVRYGLHADVTAEQVGDIVHPFGPVKLHLGGLSVFTSRDPGKEYDVLKVDVDSPDMAKLNAALSALPHTDTHKTYHPHATIAYVKAGLGERYARRMGAVDLDFESTRVAFSPPSGDKTILRLNESVVLEHGPPPHPGWQWKETTHRWIHPQTGKTHDRATGDTHPPGGRAIPAPDHVADGLADQLPGAKASPGLFKRLEDAAITAAAKVHLFLLRHHDKLDAIGTALGAILDTPGDLAKFGYNPSASAGTATAHGAKGMDPLQGLTGGNVSTHLALTVASHALAKAITWAKNRSRKAIEGDVDVRDLVAELLHELFQSINDSLGLEGVPSVEQILEGLGE